MDTPTTVVATTSTISSVMSVLDLNVIFSAIGIVLVVLGGVRSFFRNFKKDILGRIEGRIDKMETRMDQIEVRLENRMDQFENRMNQMETRFESHMDQMESRFENRCNSQDERMFLLATGKTLSEAMLEEKKKEKKL